MENFQIGIFVERVQLLYDITQLKLVDRRQFHENKLLLWELFLNTGFRSDIVMAMITW
jgi:hypothetical protein